MPFAGLLVGSDAEPAGLDLCYVCRAITLGASLRF
jgi:hypothetical protein